MGAPKFYEGRYGWVTRFPDAMLSDFEASAMGGLLFVHQTISSYQIRQLLNGIVPKRRHPFVPPMFASVEKPRKPARKKARKSSKQRSKKGFVALNYGPGVERPKWVIDFQEAEDEREASMRDERLARLGLRVGTKYFYDKYDIPEPAEGEDVIHIRAGGGGSSTSQDPRGPAGQLGGEGDDPEPGLVAGLGGQGGARRVRALDREGYRCGVGTDPGG